MRNIKFISLMSLMTISSHCFQVHLWKKQETLIRNEGWKLLKKKMFTFLLTTTFFPTCGSSFQRYQTFHQLAGLHILCACCKTCTLCNKQHPSQAWSVWVFPEMYQIGRWKIKHPGTFLGHGPLSLEHWPLWLAGVQWPWPIPPSVRHSSQCKQKTGALIRDARWWQFISWPSCLMKPLCHAHWWEHTLQDGVNIDGVRQTKMSFVLYCFCATYFSISCAVGDVLGCLYLKIGWWPFVCRWPNLRWHLILGQKKMSVHALWHSL